ncbi:hypothetical protein [Candidatus Magnetominusculus xianensis]|uniref:Uncharacterized protein n=1 Tax=Candidatus Magnetominusculus xianensis TaxID=1748249 RepID=A0ABR5SCE5_9BACT|nr:hypothetical protein [Candidatus Magnetominusculus xianensis]KWT81134.1 hypothetical protein ASN18_2640 [Candidatus Magnetominusculus xianensis]MBF0402964.1 hypothetical protein [Nitrospirota bacterium]
MASKSTITIEFTNKSSVDCEFELVKELNGDKTQFPFGKKVYFDVLTDPEAEVNLTATDGTITSEGTGTKTEEDEAVAFTDSQEQSVKRYITSITSYEWYGNDKLGEITKKDSKTIQCTIKPDPADADVGVAIGAITYVTPYRRHAIVVEDPGIDPYKIMVVAY